MCNIYIYIYSYIYLDVFTFIYVWILIYLCSHKDDCNTNVAACLLQRIGGLVVEFWLNVMEDVSSCPTPQTLFMHLGSCQSEEQLCNWKSMLVSENCNFENVFLQPPWTKHLRVQGNFPLCKLELLLLFCISLGIYLPNLRTLGTLPQNIVLPVFLIIHLSCSMFRAIVGRFSS